MNDLLQQQQHLRAAIVNDAPADGLLRGRNPLLRIYQQAYTARLLAALRDNLGVLPRAMGDEAFDALGMAYLQAHPSSHPSIRWFGHALAEFMAQQPDLVPHPAFVDLARMEWALRSAFDAADAPTLSAASVAARAPEHWPDWVLRFQPSAQVLPLSWRVEPAWRALQAADDDEPELEEPEAGQHLLLVWRPQLETRWRSVSAEIEALLLPAAMQGSSFSALCERAAQQVGEAQAAAAVVGALRQWIAEGLLAED
ncbi:MAG: DNA-binding domain-containing protein [Rhizobacter sp.]